MNTNKIYEYKHKLQGELTFEEISKLYREVLYDEYAKTKDHNVIYCYQLLRDTIDIFTQTSLTGVEIAGLVQRNEELKQLVKKQQKKISKVTTLIKKYGKYDGEKCTRGFQMYSADFNKMLDILNEVSE